MSSTLRRHAVLATAVACLSGPTYALPGPDSGWFDRVLPLVRSPEQVMAQSPDSAAELAGSAAPQEPAFMDTVQVFGQPAAAAAYLQTDVGLLVYPTSPIADTPTESQAVYVPYNEPTYVTNYVYVAPHRYTAWIPAYSPRAVIQNNGGPSLARQMQLRSQVVTRGNGMSSPAVQMQHQQASTPRLAPRPTEPPHTASQSHGAHRG